MRRAVSLLTCCVLTTSVAAAESPIDEVWIPSSALGAGWDTLGEAPSDPAGDLDLVRWGVRAQDTRHYTRHRAGLSEVCSLEIWAFASEPQAESAHAQFAYPNWEISREGHLLLMLRGRTWRRGEAPRPGVFNACRRIGDRVRERVARLLRQGSLSGSGLGGGPR
jgi:hypothetical protein